MCPVTGRPSPSVTPRQAEVCVCVCVCVCQQNSVQWAQRARGAHPCYPAVVEYWNLNPVSGFYHLFNSDPESSRSQVLGVDISISTKEPGLERLGIGIITSVSPKVTPGWLQPDSFWRLHWVGEGERKKGESSLRVKKPRCRVRGNSPAV